MTLRLLAKVIKRELDTHKGSVLHMELEVFIGTVLAQLRALAIITPDNEAYLRRYILGA